MLKKEKSHYEYYFYEKEVREWEKKHKGIKCFHDGKPVYFTKKTVEEEIK